MMVSSKGKETDPNLKKKVTEEVKQQTNKDGSGKGQMAAWKSSKIAKEYEKQGGDYISEAGSKNKPEKGPPQAKADPKADPKPEQTTSSSSDPKADHKENDKAANGDNEEEEDAVDVEKEKAEDADENGHEEGNAPKSATKSNEAKEKHKVNDDKKLTGAATKIKETKQKKEKKEPTKGSRSSARQAAAPKRKSPEGDEEEEEEEEDKPAGKKGKTSTGGVKNSAHKSEDSKSGVVKKINKEIKGGKAPAGK